MNRRLDRVHRLFVHLACLATAIAFAACGAKTPLDDGGGGIGGAGGATQGNGSGKTSAIGPGASSGAQTTMQSVSAVLASSSTGQQLDIRDRLAAIPGMTVDELPSDYAGYRYFELVFDQPEDHDAIGGKRFGQRLQLLHRGEDRPTVLFSSGYALLPFQYLSEPAALLDANQISVEHRWFDASRPADADWHHLTIRQSATDYHRIVEALAPVYPAAWINTGGSKGGMTSLYHRRFFPADLDGTVAYVAPHSYGIGDPRYVAFLDQVGSPACRDALKTYQTEMLSRRASMIPRVQDLELSGYDFSFTGLDAAFDYAVLSVRFLVWQYFDASVCDTVPGPADDDDVLWSFLQTISPVEGNDLASLVYFEPYYFQAATQLGDPGADESYLLPLLTAPGSNATDFVFPGPTKELVFDAAAMPDVQAWLDTDGEQMMFVYGEVDPWSAAMVDVSSAPDAHLFVAPQGNHGSGITSLDAADQGAATSLLVSWANAAPGAPPPAVLERARLGRLYLGTTNTQLRHRIGARIRDIDVR